jgi:hypothetical protein
MVTPSVFVKMWCVGLYLSISLVTNWRLRFFIVVSSVKEHWDIVMLLEDITILVSFS